MSDDDIVIHNVTIDICEACLSGVGGECHVPGCIFFWCPAITAEQAKRFQRAHDTKAYVRTESALNIEWGQYSMTSPSQLELERKHEL